MGRGTTQQKISSTHDVLIGARGQSCDAVCEGKNKRCDVDKMDDINNCKVLTDKFGCNTCEENEGNDQPCLNDAGICMVKTNRNLYSCSGTYPSTRRLCVCI
jgi:hypothetical protein